MRPRTPGRGADPARLAAFLANSGLSYSTNAKSYKFTCPLCRKPDKLWMLRSTGGFKCWVCAETKRFRGAPEYALRELTGQPIVAIREALYGDLSVPASTFLDIRLEDFLDTEEEDEALLDVAVVEDLPDLDWPYHCLALDRPAAAPGVAYLEGRGIPAGVAMEYDIRYSPQERAVAFPVWVGTHLVGWQFRTIDPVEVVGADGKTYERLRIWSSDGLSGLREKCVMFSNRLHVGHAVLCEGPVDALKAHLVGGNVCSMGKALSGGQVETLLRAGVERLYVAFDPDAAGELDPLLEKVGRVPTFLVEVPKPYEDLGQMPLDAARDAILGARPLKRQRIHLWFN